MADSPEPFKRPVLVRGDVSQFKPGDAVEYVNVSVAYKPLVGAIGIVERVSDKYLYVTWVSVPPTEARGLKFVQDGMKEHWMIENFRKLGAADDVR